MRSSTAPWRTTKASASASPSGTKHAAFNNCMAGGTFTGVVRRRACWECPARLQRLFHPDHREADRPTRAAFAGGLEIPLQARCPLRRDPRELGFRGPGEPATIARPGRCPGRPARGSDETDWEYESNLDGIEAPDRRTSKARCAPAGSTWGVTRSRPTPPRPADGVVHKVHRTTGSRAAGIFDTQGRGYEVAYLFHNLPLPAGERPVLGPDPGRPSAGRSSRGVTRFVRWRRTTAGPTSAGWATRARQVASRPHGPGAARGGRLRRRRPPVRGAGVVGGRDECPLLRRGHRQGPPDIRRARRRWSTGSPTARTASSTSPSADFRRGSKKWDLTLADRPGGRPGCARDRPQGAVARVARPLPGRLGPGRAGREALRHRHEGEQGADQARWTAPDGMRPLTSRSPRRRPPTGRRGSFGSSARGSGSWRLGLGRRGPPRERRLLGASRRRRWRRATAGWRSRRGPTAWSARAERPTRRRRRSRTDRRPRRWPLRALPSRPLPLPGGPRGVPRAGPAHPPSGRRE